VFGITLDDNGYEAGGTGGPLVTHGAEVHVGDSHARESVDWLRERLGERRVDVLVVDGDHQVDGIWHDLMVYGPLVAPGGLILLHDIAVTNDPRAEVHKVWPTLVAGSPHCRYETSEIRSPVRPLGWGIIHVGPDGYKP
jgi:hypothetical protein